MNASRKFLRATRGTVLTVLLVILIACVFAAVMTLLNVITLNREAQVLRGAMFGALGLQPASQVQVSVGPVIIGGTRAVLALVDRVPPEARLALKSVHAVSVGVYHLGGDPGARHYGSVFGAADEAMSRCGWSRVAGVVQHRECVVVYAPNGRTDDEPLRVCVGVCHERELIIVSATANADGLNELAARHYNFSRI